MIRKNLPLAFIAVAALVGCADSTEDGTTEVQLDSSDYVKVLDNKGDASAEAIFLDFEFEGELLSNSSFRAEAQIEEQLLYTIGHLNGDNSVGDLNKLKLTNVQTESVDGMTRITYSASLLVAWGDKDKPVTEYTFQLPHDTSSAGLEAFTEKYSHTCVDRGAHDVDSGSMWYYYRPNRSGCAMDADDVIEVPVRASVSDVNTSGKYPEYHKIWEDNAFKAVTVFGKYEDGSTTSADAGISAYNRFTREVRAQLMQFGDVTTEPAEIPSSPGVEVPDITFFATLPTGETVQVHTLLVDNVRTAGPEFNQRYAELTPDADFIAYNGHAGLGANIRSLANKGEWRTGQYSIVFMNGCDTYAYVDSALADARAELNDDDETGTKYVDIVTNAMPSFFREMPNGTLAFIRAILTRDNPATYETIFSDIDQAEVVIVSGEHDNVFVPGGGGTPVDAWTGLTESGTVAQGEEHRFETPVLPAGEYTFAISGDGDADLYVRLGEAPDEEFFDCRPFRAGSEERCVVEVPAPAALHVMVMGWDRSSNYTLEGNPL